MNYQLQILSELGFELGKGLARMQAYGFLKSIIKITLATFLLFFDFIISVVYVGKRNEVKFKYVVTKFDALGDLYIALPFILSLNKYNKTLFVVDKNFVELLENKYNIKCFGICIKKYTFNPLYRISIANKLKRVSADILLNANLSRPNLVSESVKFHIKSNRTLATFPDGVNFNRHFGRLFNFGYSELFDLNPKIHEYLKYQEIFKRINIDININREFFNKKNNESTNSITIVLGAGKIGRSWPIGNIIEVIDFILKSTSLNIKLLGGRNELVLQNKIIEIINSDRVEYLVNKTTIIQYDEIISNSNFVLCNESSAAQIANFYNINCISILGGGHFGRFLPFPKIANSSVYPVFTEMECFNCNWDCRYVSINRNVPPCISSVNVHQIKELIISKFSIIKSIN